MKNFKILSMNIGHAFIPIMEKNKKEIVKNQLKENYDIIMLQGKGLSRTDFYKELDYNCAISSKNVVTLSSKKKLFESSATEVHNSSVVYDKGLPIVFINVNCKNMKKIDQVIRACQLYSKEENAHYIKRRIIAGRFPVEFDQKKFCSMFNLKDISTTVGGDTHIENKREILNHLFISSDFEVDNIYKLVGLTEVAKTGEAYPIAATIREKNYAYKKVLR